MITVIIPAYNCEKYIGQAIESVMNQTIWEDIELLVINDKSTDNTKDVVRQYIKQYAVNEAELPIRKIYYYENPQNSGVAETRNRGMRLAKGEYIALLDADDWWTKEKLEKQMKLVKTHNAILVYSGRELMNPEGRVTGKYIGAPKSVTYKELLYTNCIPCSSVVMKTEVAREFYMCHDELHEDYIMWLQILQKYGRAYGVEDALVKCRLSEEGKSRNKLKSAKMHFGVYRYMKIPFWKSVLLFFCYAWHGVVKYR